MNIQKNQQTQVKITPDMMRSFKSFTCDCGGVMFHPGVIFKKIPSIVSPSGEEELYPLEVIVCEDCGKVPTEYNKLVLREMLPQEVLAKKKINLNNQ